jgi:hypothetical protein
VFRVAHQLVEVNLRRSHKSSGAPTAFDNAFPLESGKGMTGRHQAHLVRLGQFALGRNRVPGLQFSRINPLADGVLNALVSGRSIAVISWHD